MHVESIASFLPSVEDDQGNFSGLVMTPGSARPVPRTNVNDTVARNKQVAILRQDAAERNVAWDAELSTGLSTRRSKHSSLSDADAEGEPDPDYINDSGIMLQEPLGMLASDGSIIAIVPDTSGNMDVDANDVQFGGLSEEVPSRVSRMVCYLV